MDKGLWDLYIKSVVPLHKEKIDDIATVPVIENIAIKHVANIYHMQIPPKIPVNNLIYKKPEKNIRRQMRGGNFLVEAKIDLHGLSIDKAYDALVRFVKNCFDNHKRHLLVITGKGKFCYREYENKGVLYKLVPKWFEDSIFSGYISVYDNASSYDGGSGAFYVILRKITDF